MRTSQEAARIALRIAPTPEGLDRDEIMRLVQEALPGTERVTIAGHVSLRKVGTSLIEASFIPTGEVLWIHVFPPKVPAVRKALLSLGLQAKKL